MSDSELPPLSPDLERLFASANRAPEPPELVERVRDGVERAMVLRGLVDLGGDGPSAGGGAAGAGAAKAGAAKAGAAKAGAATTASLVSKAAALKIAAVAAGAGLAIGAGAGHQWAVHEQRDVAVTDAGAAASAVAPAASPSPWTEPSSSRSTTPPTATSGALVAPPPPPPGAPSAARASDAPASDALTGRSALRRERELVDGASGALKSGNAAQALALAERHRAQFSSGQLAEEREVLAIEALLALDRSADARARFARFQSHFQGSPATQRLQEKIDRAP